VKNNAFVLAAVVLIVGSANVNAQSSGPFKDAADQGSSSVSNVPKAALFVGVGGGYNSVNFGNQDVFAVGTSNVYQNGTLIASGSAAGPANVYMASQSNFAPSAQVGYFQHFTDSTWIWGGKFAYSYPGTTSATQNAILPQVGSFTAGGITTPFTGNALVGSYQTTINHQLSLIPFIGRSFKNSFLYLGAGPSLSQTRSKLVGVTGFADINGAHTQITGEPITLSSSQWVYGGAFVVGTTYFFDRSWFLDFSYSYDMTMSQTGTYQAPFTNSTMTEIGTLSGTSSGRATTQAFTVTINNAF
jgi:hypothetical protein